MKPHPRIRKTIKWGGAAATVLLAAVWLGSGWYTKSWRSRNGLDVSVGNGGISAVQYTLEEWEALKAMLGSFPIVNDGGAHSFAMRWRYAYLSPSSSVVWGMRVPLWLPIIPAMLAWIVAWRLDTLARRRERLNLCPKCNYDRTGLAANVVCPECGTGNAVGAASLKA